MAAMDQYDAIIIGGGIVGGTLACALGRSGMQVALVEAREPDIRIGTDPRVYAITRASEQIFRSLEVWDAIAAQPVCAFTDMEVWDAGSDGVLHFDCAELAEPWLGHIIEPGIMLAALLLRGIGQPPSERSWIAFGQHYAGLERFDDQIGDDIMPHAQKYFANILLLYAPLILKLVDKVKKAGLAMLESPDILSRSSLKKP